MEESGWRRNRPDAKWEPGDHGSVKLSFPVQARDAVMQW